MTTDFFSWRQEVEDGELLLRPGNRQDVACVTSNWLRSFRNSFHVAGVPNTVYYDNWHDIIERVIRRSVVLVLVNAKDPEQILSWICYERGAGTLILHYIYTKGPFRNRGLAKMVLEKVIELESQDGHPKDNGWACPVVHTHRTKACADIWQTHRDYEMRNWVYDPFWLYRSLGW